MTARSPLADALAGLREQVRLAEADLDRLTDNGASFDDRLAAAGQAHAARLSLTEAETAQPRAAHAHRADLFSAALGDALGGAPATPAASPALARTEDTGGLAGPSADDAAMSDVARPAASSPASPPLAPATDEHTYTPEERAFLAALNGTPEEIA